MFAGHRRICPVPLLGPHHSSTYTRPSPVVNPIKCLDSCTHALSGYILSRYVSTMRVVHVIPIAAIVARAIALVFEPENFNATAALQDLGVNLSSLSSTNALAQRPVSAPCSLAASTTLEELTTFELTVTSVYLFNNSFRTGPSLI